MSKRAQQTVTVDEIAELEALGIAQERQDEPQATPKVYPIITNPDGTRHQEQQCSIHPGLAGWYVKFWHVGWAGQFPSGECRECAKERALDVEATQHLRTESMQAEVRTRLVAAMGDAEREIAERADVKLEQYIKDNKPDWLANFQNEVRSQYSMQLKASIENDLKLEYIAKQGANQS